MPHRTSEENLKPWPHCRKNLCRQVLQEHVRCNNSNPKKKTLKYLTQILLPYNLLIKGSYPHKNTKVRIRGFIYHLVWILVHIPQERSTPTMRANVINLLLRCILFVKQIQIGLVIKMKLVKNENSLLFMFYQVLMENFITIHFPNLRQNVANFPNCNGGGGS